MFPSFKQFNNWSLPSKYNAIALVLALFGFANIVLDVYHWAFDPVFLNLQSDAFQMTAKVASEEHSALIRINASEVKTGKSVSDLVSKSILKPNGWLKENSRTEITLPEGWSLQSGIVSTHSVEKGCSLVPTNFQSYHAGHYAGHYVITVKTKSAYGPCKWLEGEYSYAVVIDVGKYKGRTIGKLTIK